MTTASASAPQRTARSPNSVGGRVEVEGDDGDRHGGEECIEGFTVGSATRMLSARRPAGPDGANIMRRRGWHAGRPDRRVRAGCETPDRGGSVVRDAPAGPRGRAGRRGPRWSVNGGYRDRTTHPPRGRPTRAPRRPDRGGRPHPAAGPPRPGPVRAARPVPPAADSARRSPPTCGPTPTAARPARCGRRCGSSARASSRPASVRTGVLDIDTGHARDPDRRRRSIST